MYHRLHELASATRREIMQGSLPLLAEYSTVVHYSERVRE